MEDDYQDILDWFLIQSKEVQKNSRILSYKDADHPFMLHIDKNTPKVFLPMMPRSAAHTENNTVSRITVAPTIVGCALGYARLESDFLDGPNQNLKKDHYRGGYEISKLEYTHCIQPNEKLVFDANRSGEHWLVPYNKKTLSYSPLKIGKFFIVEAVFLATKGSDKVQMPAARLKGYLWHEEALGIQFTRGKILEPGYYRIEMFYENPGIHTPEKEENHNAFKVSKSEYDDKKSLHAAMLSHESPKWAQW